ncbi:tyrosine-type recombinase/integrase [Fulvivirga sp. M361]|nr:tyrosine-type recombinase/integrase [Fulvivirga sp. M361]
MAGIYKRVRSYSFRDTWMNIGLQLGIDIRKLSKGLGHSSVQVTEKHYAGLIQQNLFDEINSKITKASYKKPSP